MNAFAFANRLCRDLNAESFADVSSRERQEILDAINGGIQRLDALASHESRTTTVGFSLAAPAAVSIGVTTGSTGTTGTAFTDDQLYRTIRVDGDDIDNQVIAAGELLHPYSGTTGTVSAVIYSDAMTVPEPYDEVVGNIRILETLREIENRVVGQSSRRTGEPRSFIVEPNARNQTPPVPAVIRLDSLPSQAYRLEAKFTLAPSRVAFADLLTAGSNLPIRTEYIEIYLLPICRGLLATSEMWKNADTRSIVMKSAEKAESDFATRVPRTLATPRNLCRTKPGF